MPKTLKDTTRFFSAMLFFQFFYSSITDGSFVDETRIPVFYMYRISKTINSLYIPHVPGLTFCTPEVYKRLINDAKKLKRPKKVLFMAGPYDCMIKVISLSKINNLEGENEF